LLLFYISITWYHVACEYTIWNGQACKAHHYPLSQWYNIYL